MNKTMITRRLFLGAAGTTALVVTVPVLALSKDLQSGILQVATAGQFFSAAELMVLADVAEIMIPKTETPGATDVHVLPVLDGMMLTWAGTKTKALFKALVEQVDDIAQSSFSGPYATLSQTQREAIVVEIDKKAFANKDSMLSTRYRHFKDIVFHIYYTSEAVNPDFRLIPGGYRGDLTQQELADINARGYL